MAVATSRGVSRGGQTGFTLIEIMIAVAILGVLAGLAVIAFSRSTNKAKASEVSAIFGEIKLRQQAFYLENDQYLSTGSDDTDFFPSSSPPEGGKQEVDVTLSAAPPSPQDVKWPGPAWQTLRINPDRKEMHCVYVTIAGDANDDVNVGSLAASAPFSLGSTDNPIPAVDWFYVMAECDFDGDGTVSRYFSLSESDSMIVENRGE